MRTPTKLTPQNIYYRLVKSDTLERKDYLYVILGRPGPTGKTWLRDKLRAAGLLAVEVVTGLDYFVEFKDNKNHYTVDDEQEQVVIILNERLAGK